MYNKIVAGSIIFFLLFILSGSLPGQEVIQKKVAVIHKEIQIRALKGGKPVSGLRKDDFILFVNNRERTIEGFHEHKRSIKLDSASATQSQSVPSRLFVLLFNVADYHLNVKSALSTLFNDIFKPNDRIMVITNNFSISDRLVGDLKIMKKKLENLLAVEIKKNRQSRIYMQSAIKELKDGLLHQLDTDDPQGSITNDIPGSFSFIRRSFTIYLNLLRENRSTYVDFSEKEYIKLAEYLKQQKVDKFLISFYQLGSFPRLKPQSNINKRLDFVYSYWMVNPDPQKVGSTYASQLQTLRNELEMELAVISGINEKDISKYFAGCGATVYAMLLNYKGLSDLDDDFEYGIVGTNTENVLREMSKMSGGTVEVTTDSKQFLDQVSESEDVYIILTYIPEANDGNQPKLFIRVEDPKIKVLYDNQKRPKYFREMVEEQGQSPQIAIQSLLFERRTLSFDIASFRRVKRDGKLMGRFDLRIRVYGRKSKLMFDRQKKLVCPADLLPMKIRFDELKTGKYDLVVEVKDLLTGKNDIHFRAIHIVSQRGHIRRRL